MGFTPDLSALQFDFPVDRRAAMPTHATKKPLTRTWDKITRGIIHHTGELHGRTADQHARFHTRAKEKAPNGKYYGRGWATVAYTGYVGDDARKEWILAFEKIGYNTYGNYMDSVGVVVEGDFEKEVVTVDQVQATIEMCVWIDAMLGRRLVWTFHNDVLPGYTCPGKNFPKHAVLAGIEAWYEAAEELHEAEADLEDLMDGPETLPPADTLDKMEEELGEVPVIDPTPAPPSIRKDISPLVKILVGGIILGLIFILIMAWV